MPSPDPEGAQYIEDVLIAQLAAVSAALPHILSTLDTLVTEHESNAARLLSKIDALSYSDDPDDEHELTELMLSPAAQRYFAVSSLRQTMTSLLAVGLHHLFEQQQAALSKRLGLAATNFRYEALESWPKVAELRHLANTIKHGEGSSATQLKSLRPDLFRESLLLGSKPAARQPLTGSDPLPTEKDIAEYADAICRLWNAAARSLRLAGAERARYGR